MASLSQMEQSLKDKHWEEIQKNARKNKILNDVRLIRSKKPVNLNEGMADYINRKNAEQNGVQVKPRTMPKAEVKETSKEESPKAIEDIMFKEEPTSKGIQLVSTDLFDGNNTPKETATRNEEREAASAIFNGGKKKAPARQAKPVERESAPVIDFEMLANRGYAEPTMREMPGEGIVNPTPTEQPKQRLGKDLLYSKARERSADELAEQKPMAEPKTPSSDEMWASFDDDTKAKILASYEANNK